MARRKRVVLLGATGSIGENTLKVIAGHPDELEVVGMASGSRAAELAHLAHRFGVSRLAVADPQACREAMQANLFPAGSTVLSGPAGLTELAAATEADIVVVAIVGTAGLEPTLAAIEAGKNIALASKEILVLAGEFVMAAARARGVQILPLDSEHNAIFQCLEGSSPSAVRRLVLTASGGSFLRRPLETLGSATPEEALAHPNWSMGPKITVDSATMANKGLEIIEARWLFDVPPKRIDVVIHPQSIVHSMVEFVDGSFLAQLAPPSMTFAIQHALLHPERRPGVMPSLDLSQALRLDFEPIEPARYACLGLARQALDAGGGAPAVFNAANEVAVEAFLSKRLGFLEIAALIDKTLVAVDGGAPAGLDEALAVDRAARAAARSFLPA
jgi:1-deoxy-D-xylulose-5-phosphate reductoisomerase